MIYKIKVTETFIKQYKKLDKQVQKLVHSWIKKHIYECEDPRAYGKPINGEFKDIWRYRIGDYRLLVHILDDKAVILAVKIGHRKEVYK